MLSEKINLMKKSLSASRREISQINFLFSIINKKNISEMIHAHKNVM
jgi:hypothetical protein